MGHQGFFSRGTTHKRNQLKHKKLGLCRNCSNKVKKGHMQCEYHLKKQREYGYKNRTEYNKRTC